MNNFLPPVFVITKEWVILEPSIRKPMSQTGVLQTMAGCQKVNPHAEARLNAIATVAKIADSGSSSRRKLAIRYRLTSVTPDQISLSYISGADVMSYAPSSAC